VSHTTHSQTTAYTGDAHWAALQALLSIDCGLSYQPLGPTVTPKEKEGIAVQ